MSPTDCSDKTRRLKIARRFGSAMISNTDSTLFIYLKKHIRVKVYLHKGDLQSGVVIPWTLAAGCNKPCLGLELSNCHERSGC
jgi:hypothetical protein